MDKASVIDKLPFFGKITENDKEIKAITYVFGSSRDKFQTNTSKTIQGKTLMKISSGLNHLLAWAKYQPETFGDDIEEYENERKNEIKRMFINQFSIFTKRVHMELTKPTFLDDCYRRLSNAPANIYGKKPKISQIQSDILCEWMEDFIDNKHIMKGIIWYTYDNFINNSTGKTTTRDILKVNLSKYDLFTITAMIPVTKVLHLAFSLYSSNSKSDEIVFSPVTKIMEKIYEGVIDFYTYDVYTPPTELMSLQTNNFADNFLNYLKADIDKKLGGENNRSIFENLGISTPQAKENILKTLLTSTFKILPVFHKDDTAVETDLYSDYPNWDEYKYVSNCIIKYYNQTLGKIFLNNNRHRLSAVSRTLSEDTSDNNSSYIQELFLESRNLSALERKKRAVFLVSRWSADMRARLGEYEAMLNIPDDTILEDTPLRKHMMVTVMNEMNEDIASIQMLDRDTISNLLIVISNKFYELGLRHLARAIVSAGAVETGVFQLTNDDRKRMEKLKKFKINPIKLERYITDVATRGYIPVGTGDLRKINIVEDFLRFLKLKEKKEFKLIDEGIYGYNKYYKSRQPL